MTNKKKPISPDMIRKLVDISNLDNLLELRNVCVFLLAYAGFFRIEEALLRGESRVVQVICRNHSNFFQTLFLSSLLLFTKSIIFLVLLFIMKKKQRRNYSVHHTANQAPPERIRRVSVPAVASFVDTSENNAKKIRRHDRTKFLTVEPLPKRKKETTFEMMKQS